jgi:hypothetical protein
MRPFIFIASLSSLLAQPSPDAVTIRQGETVSTLNASAQRITFVKTDVEDPKAAIANTLITQVGLNLLTMGMGSQMLRWNPYMGEAFQQFANIGKSVLTGHGNELKGFEYDTLPGLRAPVTLKPQPVEITIPLEPFRPSPDFSLESVQPVLLRLQVRLDDEVRVMAAHRVVIKQEKKGRFDMKPKSERHDAGIEERAILIQLERQPGNVLRVTTSAALEPGEYALVLRIKSENGEPTQNVALKPAGPVTPPPAQQVAAQPAPQRPKGLFGVMSPKSASTPPVPPPAADSPVGFLAWDFRVVY